MSSATAESAGYPSFLHCLQDFYRHAGQELPYFDSDAQSPLTFEASVGDVTLSVGYDPSAGDASLFIYCPFGPVPSDRSELVLRRVLASSVGAAREHNATYCIDTATGELAYYLRRNPTQVDAAWLREELVRVAQEAEQWRADPFLSVPQESESSKTQAPFSPRHAFA